MLCAKAKTRKLLHGCSGVLRKPTPQICRAGGLESCETVCQRHFDQIRREDDRNCSCPSTWGHSKKLHGHPIPSRFHNVLDEAGRSLDKYKPGTRWCNKCRDEAPKKLKNWPEPHEESSCAKRRKENLQVEVRSRVIV